MRSSGPDTSRSPRGSRIKAERLSRVASSRKSKASLSSRGDDSVLDGVKTKWRDVCDDEGVSVVAPIIRTSSSAKPVQTLEVSKQPALRVSYQDDGILPAELQFQGEVAERELFAAFCTFFTTYPTITVLRLIDCKLRSEAVTVLGNHMTEESSVRELYLDLNPIDGEDYSPLLTTSKLEILSLKGCAISGRGAELLSQKLSRSDLGLRVLNLNTNLIDSSGAVHLAKGLKWNSKLVCLSLAGNYIGSDGAISLVSVLKKFTLDQEDLEKRQVQLQKRAERILQIVKERKDGFLSKLPPMPALPSSDYNTTEKKPKKGGDYLKQTKKSDASRYTSKSNRLQASSSRLTNLGEKKRSAVSKKDLAKPAETPLKKKSRVSLKVVRTSTTTPRSEITDTSYRHDEDNELLDLSDDDSLTEFSRFSDELREDWDRGDYERRYKEKMLRVLCNDVALELKADPRNQDPLLTRVSLDPDTQQLCSKGNTTLSHLYLSYNRIDEKAFDAFIEVIVYHQKINLESVYRLGLRQLYLEGNPMPTQLLFQIDNFFLQSPSFSGSLAIQ